MKFEYFIWIIIFIALVGFSIFRGLRAIFKAEENRSNKQDSGWKMRLEKFISQVQRMTGEEDLRKDQDHGWKDLSPNQIEPPVEKSPLPEQKPAIAKAFAERIETAVSSNDISPPIYLDSGIRDLRKAVIWSEILAPPLALRNKRLK
jgi:hypothetical protein